MDCVTRVFEHYGDNKPYYNRVDKPFYQNNTAYISVKVTHIDGSYLTHWSISTQTGEVVALKTDCVWTPFYEEAKLVALEKAWQVARSYDPDVTCFLSTALVRDEVEKLERKVERLKREEEAEFDDET